MDAMDANEVVIRPESPESERAHSLLRRYFDELAERSPSGFDAADTTAVPPEELRAPHGAFLVAWIAGKIPGFSALPAGIGDVTTADIAAFLAGLRQGEGGHPPLATAWQAIFVSAQQRRAACAHSTRFTRM